MSPLSSVTSRTETDSPAPRVPEGNQQRTQVVPSLQTHGEAVLTRLLTTGQQHVLRHGQRTVVWRRLDLQQFAHQGVDVDAVERLRQEVPLETGSERAEDGLHVHVVVVEAVVTFVDVDDESLQRVREGGSGPPGGLGSRRRQSFKPEERLSAASSSSQHLQKQFGEIFTSSCQTNGVLEPRGRL